MAKIGNAKVHKKFNIAIKIYNTFGYKKHISLSLNE